LWTIEKQKRLPFGKRFCFCWISWRGIRASYKIRAIRLNP